MAKQQIVIELNQEDIKKLVAKEYGLNNYNLDIKVKHYEGCQRESSYTNLTIISTIIK